MARILLIGVEMILTSVDLTIGLQMALTGVDFADWRAVGDGWRKVGRFHGCGFGSTGT